MSLPCAHTLALTHRPSSQLEEGQRTHVARTAIDFPRALQQHEAYCQMLRDSGADVRVLDVNHTQPDSVFIEDTAIVLDEVAVLASMGTDARRAEPAALEAELRRHREVRRIDLPASIEGGDVLRVGRTLLVGLSSRTNPAGVKALEEIARHHGYGVMPVPVRGCLHLKTACTALPDDSLLVNPAWIEMTALRGFELRPVPAAEPWAANVMLVGASVCLAAAHPQTAGLIRARGFEVRTVDISEFAKAEGGVTCLSLLLPAV